MWNSLLSGVVHMSGGGGEGGVVPMSRGGRGVLSTWSWGEGMLSTWSRGGGRGVLCPCPGGEGGVVHLVLGGGWCCAHVPGGRGVLSTWFRGGGGEGGVVQRPLVLQHRMTNTCENITFARFATRAVTILRVDRHVNT